MRNPIFLKLRNAAAVSAGVLATAMLAAAPHAALAAGQVEVNYIKAERYMDIGFGTFERERNQDSLNQAFQQLAKQLPNGQTLKLDVLDVDLAGEVHPGSVRDIRIVRGGVDWPRIQLRYTLLEGQQVLKSGEAYVSDMSYLFPPRKFSQRDGALPYEQRMITRWFEDTFIQP